MSSKSIYMKKNKQLHKPYCNNIRPFKSDSRSDHYSNSSLSYVGEDAYSRLCCMNN